MHRPFDSRHGLWPWARSGFRPTGGGEGATGSARGAPHGRWLLGLLVVVGTACPPRLWAEQLTPVRLTLREAMRLAQRQQLDVVIAQERIQQAVARLSEAASTLLPQVTSSISQARRTQNLEAAGITLPGRPPLVGPFDTFDARLRLTQTLFDVAAVHRLREAQAGRARSLAEYEQARQDAMALIATLYLEAQRASEAIELSQALLVRDEARLRIANRQADLGTDSALAFQQAEAQYTESVQQWRAAFAAAIERRLDLAAALGLPSTQPILFLDEESTEGVSELAQQTVLHSPSAPPVVQVAEARVRERVAERAATKADFLPTVSTEADYGASGRTLDHSEATYGLSGQASLPLFEGGLRAARVREASSQVRESQARLSDTERHVEAQVLSAEETLQQARVLAQARTTELIVASRLLTLARIKARNGMGSALEVVETAAQAALAKDRQREGRATVQLAQVNLAHALGAMDTLLTPQSP